MANASVEKLKTLGIRHGEKAVVGLSATLCCVVAFSSQWVPRLNPALMLILFGPVFGYAMTALVPGRG